MEPTGKSQEAVNPAAQEDAAQIALVQSAALTQRESDLQRRENDLASQTLSIAAREQRVGADRLALEDRMADVVRREQALIAAEHVRDAGFSDARAALHAQLRDQRAEFERAIAAERENRLSAIDDEIVKVRARRLEDVAGAENAERERIRADIVNERDAWTSIHQNARKLLDAENMELARQKGAAAAMQSDIEGRAVELEQAERLLERKAQRQELQWQRRSEGLGDEVDTLLDEARRSQASQKQSLADENGRLRDSLSVQTGLVGAFEQLKRQLGGRDPAEILRALNSQTDELKRLREDLATRPTEEMRERHQVLESDARYHKTRAEEYARQIASNEAAMAEVGDLRRSNVEFDAQNKTLARKAVLFEGEANEAQAQLQRLRAAYERPADIAARHKEIEVPLFAVGNAVAPVKVAVDEMTWLTGIGEACETYGLHFSPRILKAFHTALKTAEWSPLTILAGVSGTGKSELPRLYSHFGGIFFEPLSVQPNWDSQESMLGYYNSIDGRFDAQPVLRFLAQSQRPWSDDYPGLSEGVCLVLLDEMNIAYPELYFAEFLSKLELRRGRKGGDLPFLPVKIGAGLAPYQLALGRNVLWAGTMNQDETTKSLSDKVIDRSIIINFPRPTELKRRLKLTSLDDANRGAPLHKSAWQGWLAQGSSFSDEQIRPFMEFIEKMNLALAVAGRALGHRVWQSIEYYMANYPDVRSAQDDRELRIAMHTAFEDQVVQKVMPKLRGIDTRGKSKTECLDKIRAQIITGVDGRHFNLSEDFDLACELGYGQFIWQSANYLNEVNTDVRTGPADALGAARTDANDEPPTSFQRDEPDQHKRHKAWHLKPPEKRDELRRALEQNERAGKIVTNNG